MLPDVVSEALDLLSHDLVIKRALSDEPTKPLPAPSNALPHPFGNVLREAAEDIRKLTEPKIETPELKVETLQGLVNVLHRRYVPACLDLIQQCFSEPPEKLIELGTLCEALVADVRSRGWSDQTLAQHFGQLSADLRDENFVSQLRNLGDRLCGPSQTFRCLVPVHVRLHDSLPTEVVCLNKTPRDLPPDLPQKGQYAEIKVEAHDPIIAAEIAHTQISSVLEAVSVFVRDGANVRSTAVAVECANVLQSVQTHRPLRRSPRRATEGQLERVARSALERAKIGDGDPVFDAIRHRRRAEEAADPESRHILLWTGIERLVFDNREHATILAAVRALVPPAITLAKLRRDSRAVAAALHRALDTLPKPDRETAHKFLLESLGDEEQLQIDPTRVLSWLLQDSEDKWQTITALFYEHDPVLLLWVDRLRKDLGRGRPEKILAYLDASHQRVERQVLRLYRARNSIAHAGSSPTWLNDLALHANHYLADLLAICLHARETAPTRSAASILTERAGQFQAYRRMLVAGIPLATQSDYLFRPTLLMGSAVQVHDDGT
jgi:hypothetical protein